MAYFLGLDLGGTTVKAGVTDGQGKILGRAETPTGPEKPGVVVDAILHAARAAIANARLTPSRVAALGLLSPGALSLQTGIVAFAANFPSWKNVPLRAKVTAGLNIPGVVENDANAAAYGEFWAGAGRKTRLRNLVLFTLGTGIGAGILLNGRVVHGAHGYAADLGHVIAVPDGELCACGHRGCIEAYASAESTARRATKLLATTRMRSTLRPVLAQNQKLNARDIATHAEAGDAIALQVWDETCKLIALAAISTIHLLDPDLVLLGGGMSSAGDFLLNTVNRHYEQNWCSTMARRCPIGLARLGPDAGIIGAAGVARDAWATRSLSRPGT